MDNIEVFFMGLLAIFLSLFTIIFIYFYVNRFRIIQELTTDIIDSIANDDELQKNLFIVGGTIGNGVKSGIGMSQASGSPKNLKQLGMKLLGDFIEGKISLPQSGLTPSPSPQPQPLPRRENDKKW